MSRAYQRSREGDRAIRCPHCGEAIGGPTTDGAAKINGLATVLVKAGAVSGPCRACRGEVIISTDGEISKAVEAAMLSNPPVRRTVFVIEPPFK